MKIPHFSFLSTTNMFLWSSSRLGLCLCLRLFDLWWQQNKKCSCLPWPSLILKPLWHLYRVFIFLYLTLPLCSMLQITHTSYLWVYCAACYSRDLHVIKGSFQLEQDYSWDLEIIPVHSFPLNVSTLNIFECSETIFHHLLFQACWFSCLLQF